MFFFRYMLTLDTIQVPARKTNKPKTEIKRRKRGDSSFSGKEKTVATMIAVTKQP
jgi:hypothetical protein